MILMPAQQTFSLLVLVCEQTISLLVFIECSRLRCGEMVCVCDSPAQ
jgi:hypothetical protein